MPWGWWGAVPGGGWPATVVRGAWCQALSLPRPPVLWSGQPGFRDPCVPGAVGAGVGTRHRPHSVRPRGPALLAVGVAEGRPRGGCLPPLWGASEARRRPSPDCPPTGRAVGARRLCAVGAGVWVWGPNTVPAARLPCGAACRGGGEGPSPGGVACHRCEGRLVSGAVPHRPPVLWSGRPGFRDPCVPGAVGAGVGTQHRPHSVRPCGPALLAVGVAGGRPRGGAFHHCGGRLGPGAVPPPTARPLGGLLGSATHVLWARVCGCGGPTLSPWPACPVGAACRGGGGGPSPGGVACHRCEGRLVSGAVPPPAARPWSGQPGFRDPCVPGAVGAGVWTQQRPHSVRPCGPALLVVGVAEGRPRGGCLPPL